MTRAGEVYVPRVVLQKARAIVVIPKSRRLGVFVGGEFGEGVATVRKSDGSWSNPFFVTLKGGSIGWQIGFDTNSILLVCNNNKSANALLNENMTLGIDASISVGVLASSVERTKSIDFSTDIFSYRKSKGLFVGVSLKVLYYLMI